jgi:hypothetical protein
VSTLTLFLNVVTFVKYRRIGESNLLRGMEFISEDEPTATSPSNLMSIACGVLQLSLLVIIM